MILGELKSYVGELTGIKANHIAYAKKGHLRTGLNWNGVLIDELAVVPVSKSDSWDDVTEKQTLNTLYKGSFTVDFLGEQALDNAVLFINMHLSQIAHEFRRDSGINFYHMSAIRNIHALDKGANQDRYQVEIKASFNKTTIINTLRIDELQTTTIKD